MSIALSNVVLLQFLRQNKYMFTGIVQTVATVVSVTRKSGDIRLTIKAADFRDETIGLGDSIACNGVCLTVVDRQGELLSFDVSIESLNHSLIGSWGTGAQINLELALLPTTRLGGHIVTGHVDGLARLVAMEEDARSTQMTFEVSSHLSRYIAKKGSITINGVSLTVNDVDENSFKINIIPHTFEMTSLSDLVVGSQVHIEVDVIARYIERLFSHAGGGSGSAENNDKKVDWELLGKSGFLNLSRN